MKQLLSNAGLLLILLSCSTAQIDNNELYKIKNTTQDIEGNIYRTVKIGNQVWFAENLRTTTFQDGSKVDTGFIPDDDQQNLLIYGRLYSWNDVVNKKSICPANWRVSTDADWKELERTIGVPEIELNNTGWRGKNNVAIALKESQPNTLFSKFDKAKINKHKFFVRAAGIKWKNWYIVQGMYAEFWTSSGASTDKAYNRTFAHSYWNWNKGEIYRSTLSKDYMFSVRCVKN